METEYLLNENFELSWACVALFAAALIMIIAYFMYKNVKETGITKSKYDPMNEEIKALETTYYFRSNPGNRIVKNSDNSFREFSYRDAKEYAKLNPDTYYIRTDVWDKAENFTVKR